MIHVLTTLYNCEEYIAKCVSSLRGQSVQDWRCYLLNDCSTDNTSSAVWKAINRDTRFVLHTNYKKRYQPGNYHAVLQRPTIYDEDVCLTLDGDDWLPDASVLQRVLNAYADEQTWLTWGSFVRWDGKQNHPCETSRRVDDVTDLRDKDWATSHLRTFKAFLFRQIKRQHLQDEQGCWWRRAGDASFMFPMLEMATNDHAKFLPDVNYVYNHANPLNDEKVDLTEQRDMARRIRQLPKYEPLIR